MADFLLEIGTEEIPARMLPGATDELARRVGELLQRERLLGGADAQLESYSSPRRLAVLARGVMASQPDVEEQILGPAVKVAYKDGQPTAAAHAFAKKVNLDISELKQVSTPKGDYLSATVQKQGRSAVELLAEMLPKEIAGIYWAKNMYWRGKTAERFVRPVRWMVAVLDGEIVPVEFAGITAGRESRGHRILSKGAVTISSPADYAKALESASVINNAADREHRIRKALDAATRTVAGARWREDADLLATVVNLTEFPSVILGNFEAEYLTLPEEVLVTVMRDHQKYFAVEDASGKLAPHFLAVLNTTAGADGEAVIRHGNERVLRARFNDARFFWNADQKKPLMDRVESLKLVTFQKELGSYHAKTVRVSKLTNVIAEELAMNGISVDRKALQEAALLAKTDLTTELVKEFTELQGVIGGLYAEEQGHDAKVAVAIYDHYKPESMENEIPRTIEGAVLAIADKADTIAGMFAHGMVPSGSKDPFALRRAANGIVRILAEKKLPLSQTALWRSQPASPTKALAEFLNERFAFYLRDARGFAYDVVNAVLSASSDDIVDAVSRAEAVSKVRPSEDFESISVAFKRMKNILRQATESGKWTPEMAQTAPSTEDMDPTEQGLFDAVPQVAASVGRLRGEKKYDEALVEISKLRQPIDVFFDKVMVMAEDAEVRRRRLYLLHKLMSEFTTIADFSEIITERKV